MVAPLTAWDPFGNELRIQALQESWTDTRQQLADVTRSAIRLYEGHQDVELHARLNILFKHPRLNSKYKELAHTDNVIAPLIRKVATVKQARVVWDTGKDQKLWDEITGRKMGSKPWKSFVPFLCRERALCKNVVVTAGWDEVRGRIELGTHYPHTCDVGWQEGNQSWDWPDTFTLLNMATPAGQRWNAAPTGFAGEHYDFVSGMVYTIRPDGSVSDSRSLPTVDGDPLRPFVPFRSSLVRGRGYWIWDGQRELIKSQTLLNWLWTCEAVTIHYGAFKMPLFTGRWTDADGKLQEILLDQTEILIAPVDPLGKDPGSVEWIGPDNGANLEQIRNSKTDVKQSLASSLHLDGEAFVSDNHGSVSGYSLRIKQHALKESHDEVVQSITPELENLVDLIRTVQNVYGAEKFMNSGTFEIIIPQFGAGETFDEEVTADTKAITAKFVTRKSVLTKYNPNLSSDELDELEDEADEFTTAEILQMQLQGVLSSAEAWVLLGIAEKLAEETVDESGGLQAPADSPDSPDSPPSPADQVPEQTITQADLATTDVQSQALNGAQMATLQAIVQAVVAGQLPAESAIQLVLISIPGISQATAEALISPATQQGAKDAPRTDAAVGADAAGTDPATDPGPSLFIGA